MNQGIRDGFKAFLEVSEIQARQHQQALGFSFSLLDAHNPQSLLGSHPLPKPARLSLLRSEAAGLGQKSFHKFTNQALIFCPDHAHANCCTSSKAQRFERSFPWIQQPPASHEMLGGLNTG